MFVSILEILTDSKSWSPPLLFFLFFPPLTGFPCCQQREKRREKGFGL
jgi:hypothetical protein